MTITEFLLARIAEDEEQARATLAESDLLDWSGRWSDAIGLYGPADGPSGHTAVVIDPARVLADCEAKRRIVEHCEPDMLTKSPGDEHVLRLLAALYADHPDFRDDWRQ